MLPDKLLQSLTKGGGTLRFATVPQGGIRKCFQE